MFAFFYRDVYCSLFCNHGLDFRKMSKCEVIIITIIIIIIVRLMTPCLSGYALTYASSRGVHTHKVNENLNPRTQQKQQQHNDYSPQQQDRPNSSSSKQLWRLRGSGGGQLRASEPPIVRLMTSCLGGCVLTYASARGVHTTK